jgi:hypothetical protein
MVIAPSSADIYNAKAARYVPRRSVRRNVPKALKLQFIFGLAMGVCPRYWEETCHYFLQRVKAGSCKEGACEIADQEAFVIPAGQ